MKIAVAFFLRFSSSMQVFLRRLCHRAARYDARAAADLLGKRFDGGPLGSVLSSVTLTACARHVRGPQGENSLISSRRLHFVK